MSTKTWNWGIIGCGLISDDFTNALSRNSRCKVVACGARSGDKARSFAVKYNIPAYNAYDSYEAVYKDPNVDIVYVGTIHPSHYRSVIAALNNGKHVLCEKPIGMNARECQGMVDAAYNNKKFLMEAMWTRFFPAYRRLRELIHGGRIGDVVHYYGDFGAAMPTVEEAPRFWRNDLGGGALLDLGCYVVNPLTMIFGPKMPRSITCTGVVDKKHAVDTFSAATVVYNDRQYAQLTSSMLGYTFEEMLISGTKGKIRVHYPAHAPTKLSLYIYGDTPETQRQVVNEQTFEFAVPQRYQTVFPGSEGMMYEVEEAVKCLDEGRTQSQAYTWQEMMTTMKMMDEMRRQIGIRYKQDERPKSKL